MVGDFDFLLFRLSFAVCAVRFAKIPENPAGQRDGVLKALELDDTLAEAHASLANIKFSNDWDWPGAEKEFQRAIALNPNDSSSHLY
jgi:tetratricopeptide (TPR) repeat protein